MCKHLPLALYTKFTPCKIIQKCFFFVLAKLKNGSGTTVTETWVSITDFCIRLLIFLKRFLDRKSKKDLRVLEFAFALKFCRKLSSRQGFLSYYLQCEILDEKTIRHTLCSKRGALPQGRRFCPMTGLIQWFSTNIQARK